MKSTCEGCVHWLEPQKWSVFYTVGLSDRCPGRFGNEPMHRAIASWRRLKLQGIHPHPEECPGYELDVAGLVREATELVAEIRAGLR